MRALTLTQPWAGLVAAGIKRIENRSRAAISKSAIGSPFAIHASREIDETVYDRIAELAPELCTVTRHASGIRTRSTSTSLTPGTVPDWYPLTRITSAIIAVSTLDGIHTLVERNAGDPSVQDVVRVSGNTVIEGNPQWRDQRRWVFGPVAYSLQNTVALPTPVKCRGWQGFWTVDFGKAALVNDQLAALRRCGARGVDADGHCVRCGLVPESGSDCPPGFLVGLEAA